MDIFVAHPSLNACGGSERLCLTIIECLREKGYNVILGTFKQTNWKKVEEFFGNITKPDTEFTHPRYFGTSAYGELLNFHILLSKISKDKTVIISTTSPWFYCPAIEKVMIYFNCAPVNYVNGIKRAYLIPYNFLQNRFIWKASNKIILTNSIFSSKVIEKVYYLKSKVIYPPVDIESFHPSTKDDLVVSIGRFDPCKKYETLIKAFSKVNNGRCIIMGSAYGNSSLRYFRKLEKLINDLGINQRVKLLANCSFSLIKYFLSKAKIYVHCAPFEYFGISVVEAMASGCVPIVHRSGGPYTDIIKYNKYGFSFKEIHELADKINLLLNNSELQKEFSQQAKKRCQIFDKKGFKKEIIEILES